ncbi:hypothetical protein MIND_01333200 [Mycena indigotica]|uniref:Uncharacterized protein n=1 Tax=Mycena indigotica TaxID=2126181 RepID=A0A8H6S0R0_9AGAR|nr:uncharacterized protein MIND_01333200 [Mycena indigotica]KAF7290198.1 hypothetical protein MIND_01333200 [Mycena indigotica]
MDSDADVDNSSEHGLEANDVNNELNPGPEVLPNNDDLPIVGDVRRQFHPHSKRSPQKMSLQEYLSETEPSKRPLPNETPWRPAFNSRIDFEVAEFATVNMLDTNAINTLISLIRRTSSCIDTFTLRNAKQMNKCWEQASKKCTNFEERTIDVQYKKKDHEFTMFVRPLWQWSLDLIRDPRVASFISWDAERLFRFDGQHPVFQMIHEAKLFPYIIYADKSKLSPFGTQKGYPIIARLGCLPVHIRNGTKWGGGQIVGWLPVIDEDSKESGKPQYTNFKNAVWHEAFYELIESIEAYSKTGIWVRCGDGQSRWLHPLVLMLVADYEEATVMTLTRGVKALFPCPICLVKTSDLSDFEVMATLRTAADSENLVVAAQQPGALQGEHEKILRDVGLRKVNNVFWKLAYSDPHHAYSFDRLHTNHSGIWGHHLFPQLKLHLEKAGSRHLSKLDEQFDALPRWRNLNHFSSVSNIAFNDGGKHCDIAKMTLYAAHNLLPGDRRFQLLLRCIRSFVVIDTYLALKIQTANTIQQGREEVKRFGRLIQEYSQACIGTEFAKNWNFPKIHLLLHAFDDIIRKGASRNFSTNIDESMHGPIRDAYLNLTNKKNVGPQILKFVHRSTVATLIREQIDDIDESVALSKRKEDVSKDGNNCNVADSEQVGNSEIGGKRDKVSFLSLETKMAQDAGFKNFRTRFTSFFNNFLLAFDYVSQDHPRTTLQPTDEIQPYSFLKVHFPSLDSWAGEADYLRCSPQFHGRPRYDAAFVQTTDGIIVARLIFIFSCKFKDKILPFALVQPYDAPIPRPASQKDQDLGLIRFRSKPRRQTEFISVHSIIRGVYLAPDFGRNDGLEYLAADIVDTDMFFRLKSL